MKDFFLINTGSHTVLFSPLAGLLLEIESEEREWLERLIAKPSVTLDGLINLFQELDRSRLLVVHPKEAAAVIDGEFHPDAAMLFPTMGCHLRCTYCYAKGGDEKLNMEQDVATATVDLIVNNACGTGSGHCSIEFHGGGEPTWNWPIFEYALTYLAQQARRFGVEHEVSLATNGMLSPQKLDWIASRIQSVQVSLDGTPDIQNSQRPTPGSKPSFPIVARAVNTFLNRGIGVTIHSVITEQSMGRIPEIVQFLGDQFPGAAVQLEPAFPCGRGLVTGQRFPSIDLFIRGFMNALQIARTKGMTVDYSGANAEFTRIRKTFCGVTGPNFIVTPSGLVTACNEIVNFTNPLAKYFIYGHFDRASGRFIFQPERIQRLRSYDATTNHECDECYARFTCAGECLIKNIDTDGISKPSLLNPRCTINRLLTKRFIDDRLSREEVMST